MSVLVAWSIGIALIYLVATVLALVVLAVRIGGFRATPPSDHDEMFSSRFTIPVSLIVPVSTGSDSRAVNDTITALLGLNYPKFEIIVVADGPADALVAAWDLKAREVFYRAALATAPVRMLYRSSRDARLLVVAKGAANLADALNCGVNLARFRYVIAVEPGVTFDAEALLRILTAPLRDPATVVGATSHVEIGPGTLQRLRSIRSMMYSRLIGQTAPAIGSLDTVVVWRRDAVAQCGGFAAAAVDPHLDMSVRLQSSTAVARGPVVRTAEVFGRRNRRPFAEYVQAMARRQASAVQTVVSLIATGSGTRAMLASFVLVELLTPCLQAWVAVGTMWGAAAGWWPWVNVALAVVLLAFGQAVLSCAALLLRGSRILAPDARELRRLVLLAPVELILTGVVNASARVAGVVLACRTSQFRSIVDDHRATPAA